MRPQTPTDVNVTVGVDTHADQHVGVALDHLVASWEPSRFPRPRPATPRCWPGRGGSGRWNGSGSRAPAATAPA